MLAYQETLYNLVQDLGIGDEALVQETYFELEQAFLDRWTVMLLSKLSDTDQEIADQKVAAGATPEEIYLFLESKIADIEQINQDILDEFVTQYREMMDMD